MRSLFILTLIFTTTASTLLGQTNCSCEQAFEQLNAKLAANYIALQLDPKEGWEAHKSKFRTEAANTQAEQCTALLGKFLKFWGDGHLFVAEYPEYEPAVLDKFKQNSKSGMSAEEVLKYLETNKASLHPLEGIWTDGQLKLGIIKNTKWEDYGFVTIILTHPQTEKIGEIKLFLNEKGESLSGKYFTNAYAPRYVEPQMLKENTILSLGGGIFWGRTSWESPLINPIAPSYKKLNTETILLSLPSFSIEKQDLDALLDKCESEMKSSRYLIIDIRGNTGGNGIYFDLLRWFAKRPLQDPTGLALSSPDNIQYFERAADGRKNLYAVVAETMRKNPDKIVDGPVYQSQSLKPIKSKLEKVIILTDGANASAAEQFIIHAKMVGDIITMGQPTAGVIDYQSVNMVKLDCAPIGIRFGYPTSTSNKNIPGKGYNKGGITPDVLNEKTGEELVQLALEYVGNLK